MRKFQRELFMQVRSEVRRAGGECFLDVRPSGAHPRITVIYKGATRYAVLASTPRRRESNIRTVIGQVRRMMREMASGA